MAPQPARAAAQGRSSSKGSPCSPTTPEASCSISAAARRNAGSSAPTLSLRRYSCPKPRRKRSAAAASPLAAPPLAKHALKSRLSSEPTSLDSREP
eukprot:scaffold2459_cov72-Phaeocystis_antarctica.AAC.7